MALEKLLADFTIFFEESARTDRNFSLTLAYIYKDISAELS